MAKLPVTDEHDKPAVISEAEWLKTGKIIVNAVMLVAFMVLCIYIIKYIIQLWPSADTSIQKTSLQFLFIKIDLLINPERRYFLLVALGGALGAFVHIGTSFTDFIGNKKLVYSWLPWYILRPFIGSALALIFYLLVRGGIISPQSPNSESSIPQNNVRAVPDTSAKSSGKDSLGTVQYDGFSKKTESNSEKSNPKESSPPINPFGIMAIACMAGMFSKHATDKLREIFENLFRLEKDTPRKNPLNNNSNSGSQTSTPAGAVPNSVAAVDDAGDNPDDVPQG